MKKITKISLLFLSLFVAIAAVSCSSDDTDGGNNDYGYVQFLLYKSASYNETRANDLEYLSDAAKIKVTLKSSGGDIFSQTVNVSASTSAQAEYGMQSDKMMLRTGTYSVLSYTLYGKLDEVIATIENDDPVTINVYGGGLILHDVIVNVVARGFVNFTLVKDMSDVDIPDTRAITTVDPSERPFYGITYADVTIKNLSTNEEIEIKELPTIHVYDRDDVDPSYIESYCTTDSLVSVKAGTYKIIKYVTYYDSAKKIKYAESESSIADNSFVVVDNETTKADVPVNLFNTAPYIQDGITLYNIWKALDGENWKVKWDFNRDVDLWTAQTGVSVHSGNGRVATLDLEAVGGARGDLPAEIGDLTDLLHLYIGTHSYVTATSNITSYASVPSTPQIYSGLKTTMSDSFRETFYGNGDARAKYLSDELILALEENGDVVKKNTLTTYQLPTANSDVNYATYITSIPDEINNLTNLESLYIAYSPITTLPSDLSGLTALTDLEVYYCPDLEEFPAGIATLPKIQMLIFACNFNVSASDMYDGLVSLTNGNAAATLQGLQIPTQNLERVPDLRNIVKMSQLNVSNCGIYEFETPLETLPLMSFDASMNNLTSLPRASDGRFVSYGNLTPIETLDLSYNKFTELPDIFDASSVMRIETVDFSNNLIEGLENGSSFKGVNAATLALGYNKFSTFPKEIIHTASPISYLQIQANEIETIDDDAFEGGYTYLMTTLDMSYNKISELPTTFGNKNLPYMTGLDLSYNRFTAIPSNVLNISALTTLVFRNQRDANGYRVMKTWPSNIYTHKGLRALFLGGNDIGVVNDTTISYLIYNLEIADNPNIVINVSTVCSYITSGIYNLIYDPTQDIRGCAALWLTNN